MLTLRFWSILKSNATMVLLVFSLKNVEKEEKQKKLKLDGFDQIQVSVASFLFFLIILLNL